MELLSDLAVVFATALLPAVLYCSAGALADRYLEFDLRSLSRLMVYVLLPALLFASLMQVEVSADEVLRVAIFNVAILALMALAGWIYARALGMDAATTSSTVLAVTFFNAVNLGFPVLLYAYGDEGLKLGGVLVAVNSLPHNGFGLYIAARGHLSHHETARVLLRMPILYALAAAALLRILHWEVPEIVLGPVDTLGRAGVTLVLVLVGMELRRIQLGAISFQVLGAVALRLLLAPALAWLLADLVGLTGLLRTIVIIQASMPSAVMPIIYARQFGGNVEFVSKAVFYSTIGSIVTLPVLLILLPGE